MPPKNNCRSHTRSPVSNGLFCFMFFMILLASTRLHASPMESFLLFFSNNIQGEIEPCG